jgi:cytoskeleton protein RodZ
VALEEDNYHLLPATVYAAGFVKRYSRLLGLDEKEIVDEFKRASGRYDTMDDEEAGSKRVRDKINVPLKNIITGLIFLAIVVWMGTYLVEYLVHREGARNNQTPTPPITSNEPSEEPKEPPVFEGVNLRITGVELCWIRATVDGELIPDTMLQPGQIKEIEATESVQLHLGNAGGVRIEYNGEDMGVPGERGKTIRLTYPPPE